MVSIRWFWSDGFRWFILERLPSEGSHSGDDQKRSASVSNGLTFGWWNGRMRIALFLHLTLSKSLSCTAYYSDYSYHLILWPIEFAHPILNFNHLTSWHVLNFSLDFDVLRKSWRCPKTCQQGQNVSRTRTREPRTGRGPTWMVGQCVLSSSPESRNCEHRILYEKYLSSTYANAMTNDTEIQWIIRQ